jgi:hypothetical protein
MPNLKLSMIRLPFLVVVLFLALPVSLATAQESESEGMTVIAGPHSVRVVMVNSNLAAGFIQMALYVTDANTGAVVSDARVVVMAANEEEEYEGWGTALNSPAKPEQYDIRMNLGSTGEWVLSVDVSSPLGQGGAETLTLEVPTLNRYTNGSLVFFGVFAAIMLGVAYLFWSVRRSNCRNATPD